MHGLCTVYARFMHGLFLTPIYARFKTGICRILVTSVYKFSLSPFEESFYKHFFFTYVRGLKVTFVQGLYLRLEAKALR
jgi:hypothetical protein